MTEQLLCLKETWIYMDIYIILFELCCWAGHQNRLRKEGLACLVNHGQPPEISRDRHLPGRDDAGTAATTTETIWTTMMMNGSMKSNNQNSLVIGKSFVINQLRKMVWDVSTHQNQRYFCRKTGCGFHTFSSFNVSNFPGFSPLHGLVAAWMVSPHVALMQKAAEQRDVGGLLLRWSVQERWCSTDIEALKFIKR